MVMVAMFRLFLAANPVDIPVLSIRLRETGKANLQEEQLWFRQWGRSHVMLAHPVHMQCTLSGLHWTIPRIWEENFSRTTITLVLWP
mmetsp:Transcript_53514/g.78357  ORF Transcript_53514/g.78357 Transcript_53514/m.78357 type:complete len:87 (+) Transcript_53514:71-331(+)